MVEANTSLASLGGGLPQEEKLKLAHKLFTVSSRTSRVLMCLFDRVADIDLFFFILLAGVVGTGEQSAPGRLRANCSERASEDALVRKGRSPGEE